MQSLLDLVLDIVLSPALWLCVVFGVVYGVLFTMWRGAGWRQLVRDMGAGVIGFGAGQLFASLTRLPSLRVGEVHLLWGSLASAFFLLAGRRLLRPKAPPARAKSGPAKS